MAIIITGKTTCSICDEVLEEGQEVYATSAFLRSEHPLWRFSDSGMHWDCFENWAHRADFVEALIAVVTSPNHEWGSDTAFEGDYCSVLLNLVVPMEPEAGTVDFEHRRAAPRENPRITIWLHDVGVSLSTTLKEWDGWLREDRSFEREPVQKAWKDAQEELIGMSSEDLVSMVDIEAVYDAWNRRAERQSVLDGQRDAEKAALIAEHNQNLHEIIDSKPSCPHCGQSFQALKYYDNRGRGRKSCIICQECARSSRVEEFKGEIAF